MSVTNVTGLVNLNISFTDALSTGIVAPTLGGGSQARQSLVAIAQQFANAASGADSCDLMHASQYTLAASPTTIDFAALADPSGTNRDWTSGRCRVLIAQVVSTTAGFNVTFAANASNGWTVLPAAATPVSAYANGGILLVYDPASNGGGVGAVITAGSSVFDMDPGAHTVVLNLIIVGNSAA